MRVRTATKPLNWKKLTFLYTKTKWKKQSIKIPQKLSVKLKSAFSQEAVVTPNNVCQFFG